MGEIFKVILANGTSRTEAGCESRRIVAAKTRTTFGFHSNSKQLKTICPSGHSCVRSMSEMPPQDACFSCWKTILYYHIIRKSAFVMRQVW